MSNKELMQRFEDDCREVLDGKYDMRKVDDCHYWHTDTNNLFRVWLMGDGEIDCLKEDIARAMRINAQLATENVQLRTRVESLEQGLLDLVFPVAQ